MTVESSKKASDGLSVLSVKISKDIQLVEMCIDLFWSAHKTRAIGWWKQSEKLDYFQNNTH